MKKGFLIGLLTLLITSCSQTMWLRKEAIPKDITNPAYTLLIIKLDETESKQPQQHLVNPKIEKILKDYPYPVAFITKEELESEKYSDVNKYRYVLRRTAITAILSYATDYKTPSGSGLSQGVHRQHRLAEQYFTDRKEGIDFPTSDYQVVRFDIGVKNILKYSKNGK